MEHYLALDCHAEISAENFDETSEVGQIDVRRALLLIRVGCTAQANPHVTSVVHDGDIAVDTKSDMATHTDFDLTRSFGIEPTSAINGYIAALLGNCGRG